ncbi:MAG: hypothetical protein PHQ65_12920 [Bacteroidales bacterium]|nr:hypothetical protein [Bacteroidales bacterium]MDD3666161.1 hypothetical protein [Bacteroidales bacterium]
MKSVVSLFLIIITISLCDFSQTVYFDYDASGNRTQRYIEVKEVRAALPFLNETIKSF